MNRLTRKLENLATLSEDDKRLLDDVIGAPRKVDARTDLIREGDAPDNVHLILDGFACRYKLTSEGERQIMAYLVPGDFCDLHVAILKRMDHGIATLQRGRDPVCPPARPAIARALWWATLVDEAVLREWLVNIGRREAPQALAHLLAELLFRLRAVGLAEGDSYELPLTQQELGDTLGLSTVHVNRSLHVLRTENLITLKNKSVTILDTESLFEFSGFNANYLHLLGKQSTAASN